MRGNLKLCLTKDMRFIPCGDLVPPPIVWPFILDLVPPVREEDAERCLTLSVFRQLMQAHPAPRDALDTKSPLFKILNITTRYGRLSPLQWLECRGLLDGDAASALCLDVCQAAAAHGHLHICEWLHQHNYLTSSHFQAAFRAAALAGQLATVQWIIPHLYPTPAPFEVLKKQFATHDMRDTLYTTIQGGHTHVARFLIEHFGFTRANLFGRESTNFLPFVTKYRLLDECVDSGDVQFCQWAHARFRFKRDDVNTALRSAARMGSLDMCQWLVSAFRLDTHYAFDAVRDAVLFGKLPVVEWLMDHFKMEDSERGLDLMKDAIIGGDQEHTVVQYLAERFQITADMVRNPHHDGFTCLGLRANDRYGLLLEAAFRKSPLCQWVIDYFGMTMQDVVVMWLSDVNEMREAGITDPKWDALANWIVEHCNL